MLNNLDSYLIDKIFQRFAHWWQELTGLTNFWIAKWMYVCTAILATFLLIVWAVLTNMPTFFNSIVYLILTLVFILMIHGIFILEMKDKEFTKKHSGVINEGRINGVGRRVLGLIVTVIFLINFLYFFMDNIKLLLEIFTITYFFLQVCYFIGVYFEDCTPLPPGKSKLKKWNEKTLFKINKKMFEKEEPPGPPFW